MSKEQENKDEKDNKKEVAIIVNGKQREVAKKDLSFADVVALAFDTPPTGENILFTITYRRGHGDKPEGTLIEGQSIKVKDGMIFNVTATDKS
ncbi:MAG: multiubiquitin domain-containing protein [Pyrinomonadaceae bacterium]